MPGCASNPQCVNGQCVYRPTATAACLPPDVAFCDPGGHPECNLSGSGYPADAGACGVKECWVDASTCYWSGCMGLVSH
jgi:hypothetical protein